MTNKKLCKHLIIQIAIIVIFNIASSNSFFDYVPDAQDDEDVLKFPWERETNKTWKRNILNGCGCGTKFPSNSTSDPESWNVLIKIKHEPRTIYDSASKRQKESNVAFCGGTLINNLFILTAYSCFSKPNMNPLNVWGPNSFKTHPNNITVFFNVGVHSHIRHDKTKGFSVNEIIYDTRYAVSLIKNQLTSYNIALLRLTKKIDLLAAGSANPICLNPLVVITTGKNLVGTGWKSGLMQSRPNIFLKNPFKANLFELHDCRVLSGLTISDSHFCTPEGLKGDMPDGKGWPILIYLKAGTVIQLGVASWDSIKKPEDLQHRHVFYTNVTAILPFIYYHSEKAGASWCKEPVQEVTKDSSKKNSGLAANTWKSFTSANRVEITGCVCGVHDAATGRIVGGTTALPNEFKWQVYLKFKVDVNNRQRKAWQVCGGSLINDRMILTAAHCVIQSEKKMDDDPAVSPENSQVFLHVHNRQTDLSVERKIKSIHFHPGFVESTQWDWDVALVELTEPINLSVEKDTIIPICLPESNEELDPVGKTGLVTGWGFTSTGEDKKLADELQKIELPIQKLEYCNSILLNNTATSRFLCAGTLDQNKDAAQGDSGGPLTILKSGKDNQYVQVGIVSYEESVGSRTAAFYTDVRAILSFIDYFSYQAGAKWCHS